MMVLLTIVAILNAMLMLVSAWFVVYFFIKNHSVDSVIEIYEVILDGVARCVSTLNILGVFYVLTILPTLLFVVVWTLFLFHVVLREKSRILTIEHKLERVDRRHRMI